MRMLQCGRLIVFFIVFASAMVLSKPYPTSTDNAATLSDKSNPAKLPEAASPSEQDIDVPDYLQMFKRDASYDEGNDGLDEDDMLRIGEKNEEDRVEDSSADTAKNSVGFGDDDDEKETQNPAIVGDSKTSEPKDALETETESPDTLDASSSTVDPAFESTKLLESEGTHASNFMDSTQLPSQPNGKSSPAASSEIQESTTIDANTTPSFDDRDTGAATSTVESVTDENNGEFVTTPDYTDSLSREATASTAATDDMSILEATATTETDLQSTDEDEDFSAEPRNAVESTAATSADTTGSDDNVSVDETSTSDPLQASSNEASPTSSPDLDFTSSNIEGINITSTSTAQQDGSTTTTRNNEEENDGKREDGSRDNQIASMPLQYYYKSLWNNVFFVFQVPRFM